MSELREAKDPAAFVGRQTELAQLHAGLDRASKQHGGLFLLTGEPGIGKTRLAEQVAAEARDRGWPVYWGLATQAEGAPPYWPCMQILRALLRDVGRDEFGRLAGGSLEQILQIAPALRAHFPDAALAPEDEASRFRAYDAVARLLVEAAGRQPIVLILEDLHWADTASLILLQQLSGDIPHSRLMVIGTFRARELATDHPLKVQLADFIRRGDTIEIALAGLGEADAANLVRAATDFEPASDLVRRLQQQTAGNPFFLKELARIFRDDQVQPVESSGVVPEGVAAVLRRRISGLTPGCVEALAFAAVAGQEIDLSLLSSATGIAPAQLLDRCDEAVSGGVLAYGDRGYAFAHGLFRDTVYGGLSTARRAELHARIGRTLEQRQGPVAIGAARLAHHFVQAAVADESLRETALDYSLQAADQASAELAYEAAVRHLEAALGLAGSGEAAQRFEILAKLGRARYLAGDVGGAVKTAQEASALAERLDDGELLARAALVVRGVGGPGIAPIVKGLCDAALRKPPADPVLRIQLLSQVVVILMQIGDPESVGRARDYSEEAIRLARDAMDPDIVFAALHSRQMATSGPDGVLERLAIAERVLALARETGRVTFEHWGHSWRADALVQLGRVDEAELEVTEQKRTAHVLREPLAQWRSLLARSWIALLRGRLDSARELSEDARRLGSKGNPPVAEFNYFAHEKAFADLTGRGEYHRDHIEAFVRQYPEMVLPFITYDVIELAAEGRLAEARTALRPIAAVRPSEVRPLMAWLPAMATIARGAAAVGNQEIASAVYEALTPYADQVVTSTAGLAAVHGSVARYLGILATALERWDDAARHFEAAIALERRIGAPPYVAWSEILYAELLLQRGAEGDLRHARRLAADAQTICRGLGMAPWLQRAEAVIRSVAAKGVASHPLSKRELEVAALVAEGLSNHAIAERLHLSERTAESHVKNICDKLGFNSRSQVAAWVGSRNLGTEIQ